MKGFSIILFVIIATKLLGQDFQLAIQGDTLTIRVENITSDPFQFGTNPLSYLQKFNPAKTFRIYKNIHAENRIDTIFTLTVGKNTFEIMKIFKDQNWLFYANVTTNKFRTKHGLEVGMEKNDVIKQLEMYKLKSIPGYLIFEETEVFQSIVFEFTGKRLTKITFLGYSD